jgi:hypothetical protein
MNIRTLAAAVLALGLSACAAEFNGVGIYAICSPPEPDGTTGACLYPATCDATFAGTPVLDVTTAQLDFRLPFQVNNALPDNSSTSDGRINTNDAFIQSLEITYSGATLAPWNVAEALTVPAAGSSGALLRLIPVQYFPALVPTGASRLSIVVNVRAKGILASQDSFTTAWFQVPVEVCAGCLSGAFCPAGSVMASCPSAALGQTSPGQSASVTCIGAALQ